MKGLLDDLFLSIYMYLGFGLLFATITMMALPLIKNLGIKNALIEMLHNLKSDRIYFCKFVFFLYLFMVLSRTLICRNIWKVPWENVVGNWGIFLSDGSYNFEGFLNVALFLPLSLFMLLGFPSLSKGKTIVKILYFALKKGLLFSICIELCQLFLRLGTFQFSDMAQNTLGGLLGAGIYLVIMKIGKFKIFRGCFYDGK